MNQVTTSVGVRKRRLLACKKRNDVYLVIECLVFFFGEKILYIETLSANLYSSFISLQLQFHFLVSSQIRKNNDTATYIQLAKTGQLFNDSRLNG